MKRQDYKSRLIDRQVDEYLAVIDGLTEEKQQYKVVRKRTPYKI